MGLCVAAGSTVDLAAVGRVVFNVGSGAVERRINGVAVLQRSDRMTGFTGATLLWFFIHIDLTVGNCTGFTLVVARLEVVSWLTDLALGLGVIAVMVEVFAVGDGSGDTLIAHQSEAGVKALETSAGVRGHDTVLDVRVGVTGATGDGICVAAVDHEVSVAGIADKGGVAVCLVVLAVLNELGIGGELGLVILLPAAGRTNVDGSARIVVHGGVSCGTEVASNSDWLKLKIQ